MDIASLHVRVRRGTTRADFGCADQSNPNDRTSGVLSCQNVSSFVSALVPGLDAPDVPLRETVTHLCIFNCGIDLVAGCRCSTDVFCDRAVVCLGRSAAPTVQNLLDNARFGVFGVFGTSPV